MNNLNNLFYIKKGDLEPPIEATLYKADGSVMDLSDAVSVKFLMQPDLDAPAEIVDPATDGRVKYAWEDGDTESAGHFLAEFEITWAASRFQTVPNRSHIHIYITEDVG